MSFVATIRQFCSSIGLPPQDPPLALDMERSGTLRVELTQGKVAVSLARPFPLHREGVADAALRAVHPDRGISMPIRAAFQGDETLVLFALIDEPIFDLSVLEEAFSLLSRLLRDIDAGTQ